MKISDITYQHPLHETFSVLDEIKMSPATLASLAAEANAVAGLEFELIVPDIVDMDQQESEIDFSKDTAPRSIDHVVEFFTDNTGLNSSRTLQKLRKLMQRDYERWVEENNVEPNTDNQQHWFESIGISALSEIPDVYFLSGVMWTHFTEPIDGPDLKSLSEEFAHVINRRTTYGAYSAGKDTQTDNYRVELDGTLKSANPEDHGVEIVSPALPLNDMVEDFRKVVSWAHERGCYTGAEYNTGLHMNVSIPVYSKRNIDYVKTVLFLGDQYVLEKFNRAANEYCVSALSKIRSIIDSDPQKVAGALEIMGSHLSTIAGKFVHESETTKYTSVSLKDNRVEFRGPGGDWLGKDLEEMITTLYRFVVALDIGCDRTKHQREYYTKLYKLLTNGTGDPMVQLFAEYKSGKLKPADINARLSTVRQQKPVSKIPVAWTVTHAGSNHSGKFNASTEKLALEMARVEWDMPKLKYPDEQFVVAKT